MLPPTYTIMHVSHYMLIAEPNRHAWAPHSTLQISCTHHDTCMNICWLLLSNPNLKAEVEEIMGWLGLVGLQQTTKYLHPNWDAFAHAAHASHLAPCNIYIPMYMYMYMYSTGQRQGIMQTRSARVCLWRQTHLSTETNAFFSSDECAYPLV